MGAVEYWRAESTLALLFGGHRPPLQFVRYAASVNRSIGWSCLSELDRFNQSSFPNDRAI